MVQLLLPFYSFALLAHFDYVLRTHFALTREPCQATFGVKLYQRMIK
jgi:hypothetical protein